MTVTPLRFSDLTPDLIGALRILAALEVCYPQCGDRASRTLEGHKAWRAKQSRVINMPSGQVPDLERNER